MHPPFRLGLMPKLGLKYRTEFNMSIMSFLFRDRVWLRSHGCTQEPGETWRAADAGWYRTRGYIDRPIAAWYAVFDGENAVDHRVPWPIPRGKTLRRADLDDFTIRLDLPGGLRFYGQTPDDGGATAVFLSKDEAKTTDAPVYIPGRRFLVDLTISPCLRPGDVFLPLLEGKWIYQYGPRDYAYVAGSGSWVVTRASTQDGELTSQFFMQRIDSSTRTPRINSFKLSFRDVARWVSEAAL